MVGRRGYMLKRKRIDGQWFKITPTGRIGKVPLTRCSNTQTEAEYKGWVLSGLRGLTRKWKPAADAWNVNTRAKPKDIKGKHRIEHQCSKCLEWGPKKTKKNSWGMELDHINNIGGYSVGFDVWVERAFVEIDGYQKVCTTCHRRKSNDERIKTNGEKT